LSKKESFQGFKIDMMEKIAALVSAAFGLVAALAWNDLIKTIFAETFGTTAAIGAMVIYAIIVTIIAVILTVTIANAVSKTKSVFRQDVFKCELCPFETKMESKFMEHQIKDHASSPDKFLMK
jgi:Na+(H+)/acetate symporter ActP